MSSTTTNVLRGRHASEQQPSAYSFGGSTMTVLVPGAETGGAFSLVHIRKRADSSTPRHLHDFETEVSYVLEGTLGLETSAGVAHLGKHEWHVLSPQRAHRVFNDSPSEVRELLLCAPAIFDKLVATAGEPVAAFSDPRAITEEAIKSISTHAPNFGVRLFREAPDEPSTSHERAEVERLEAWGGQFEVLATLGDQDEAIALLRFTLHPGAGDGWVQASVVSGGGIDGVLPRRRRLAGDDERGRCERRSRCTLRPQEPERRGGNRPDRFHPRNASPAAFDRRRRPGAGPGFDALVRESWYCAPGRQCCDRIAPLQPNDFPRGSASRV